MISCLFIIILYIIRKKWLKKSVFSKIGFDINMISVCIHIIPSNENKRNFLLK